MSDTPTPEEPAAETRASLRALGRQVQVELQHGQNPPRRRALYQSGLPGLGSFTAEALWGSVWARSTLPRRERLLATVTVLVSLQRLPQLRTYLNSALNLGLDPVELHEVIIQCSLHAGVPATVNGLELLRDVLEHRGATTVMPEVAEVPLEELDRRGRALFVELFGALPPDGEGPDDEGTGDRGAGAALAAVELRFAFGEILCRPGLDRRARVIVAIAASLALRDEAEVARWRSAGLRAGMTAAECDEVLVQGALYSGIAPALRALRAAGPGRD